MTLDNVSLPQTSSNTFPNTNGTNIQNANPLGLNSDIFNESIWKVLEFSESNSSASPFVDITTPAKDEESSSGFGLFLLAAGLAIFILMSLGTLLYLKRHRLQELRHRLFPVYTFTNEEEGDWQVLLNNEVRPPKTELQNGDVKRSSLNNIKFKSKSP